MSRNHFTKSLFKMGITCPTKLFYKNNPVYGSNEKSDDYLTALAEGGILVEYVAKKFFPQGKLVEAENNEDSANLTKQLMVNNEITLFEPTFITNDLLARPDIVVKQDNKITLIEIKAKSFNPSKDSILNRQSKKQSKLSEEFKPYILDILFQANVIKACYPDHQIQPILFLLDKTKQNTMDELLRSFSLVKEHGKAKVNEKKAISYPELESSFFYQLDLSNNDTMNSLLGGGITFESLTGSDFKGNLAVLADLWRNKTKFLPQVGSQCKKCEYRNFDSAKSGFYECWSSTKALSVEQTKELFCFDLWQLSRSPKKIDELIEHGKCLLRNVTSEDLSGAYAKRQEIIIEKYKNSDLSEYIAPDLKKNIEELTFPLHFIDFEIARLPIPSCTNMKPYQLIPFQFSIHTLSKDNEITHKQFINLNRGYHPILDFINELVDLLSNDEGSIIHYHHFEVSILKEIQEFLKVTDLVKHGMTMQVIDKLISRSVDLQQIIVKYYYHPKTKNSNSIKDVLPAILSSSPTLKTKYSKDIYGSKRDIHSLNFDSIAWIQFDKVGNVIDPYKHLPPILQDYENDEVESFAEAIEEKENKNNGGAAMLAYARAQYFDIDDKEKDLLRDALLKYCELDSFAMVLIYEHLRNITLENQN